MENLIFENASLDLLDEISNMEKASYPPEEPASRERIEWRIKVANPFFFVVLDPKQNRKLLGFVNGTVNASLTHDSMGEHHPEEKTLCIHSVVICQENRRKGLGSAMLLRYVKHFQDHPSHLKKLALLCKKPLIEFYKKAGFSLIGPSKIDYGKDQWFDMELSL